MVRQCKETSCLTVFTSRESVISVIENSQDKHVLMDLAARIAKLPDTAWATFGFDDDATARNDNVQVLPLVAAGRDGAEARVLVQVRW